MTQSDFKRQELLKKFVTAEDNLPLLAGELAQYDWDFNGDAVLLTADALRSVLLRFVEEYLSANDIYFWADTLELREDIEIEKGAVADILHQLANPDLEGALTVQQASQWISELKS